MSLQNEIFFRIAESKFGDEKKDFYLPNGCVEELITQSTIRENLKYYADISEQTLLVDFIEQRAKKVFAITILLVKDDELWQAMTRFQEHGFIDSLLPVSDIDGSDVRNIREAFSDGKLWNLWRKFEFEKKQWMFLAPVFTQHQLIYKFERDHILPFKSVSSKVKEGTFGDVFEVEIHESHQKGDIFKVSNSKHLFACEVEDSLRSGQWEASQYCCEGDSCS